VRPATDRELVTMIQRGLASLGFFRAAIDGHPGEATAKAIREFENFHSYQVTGAVNPDLVGLLRDAGATI
jgi:peptidoglycan hydrolase-like protein with peptidoglycan-binding domain